MTERQRDFQHLLERLQGALAHLGSTGLGDVWDVSSQEAGRRINGERGMKLEDFARAMAEAGIQIVTTDDVVVNRRKYESLLEWANEGMRVERDTLRAIPKRASD